VNLKEEIFAYLIDIEEDKAAEILKEADIDKLFIDVAAFEFDEWMICDYQILIRGKYLKALETEYIKQKELIEGLVSKFAQIDQEVVRHISWLPLPKIKTELSKYNQNDKMKQLLIDGEFDQFFGDVKSIFASLSYNMKVTEAYFHTSIHILLKTLGFSIVSEDESNLGRIDSTIELDTKIIIMEFKTSSSSEALAQIQERKYYEKYLIKRKDIFLVGVGCSIVERNIKDWIIHQYH
jgi:hypothetical protein